MATIICYLLLEKFTPGDWSGWLLVLPVMLDLTLLDKLK